MRKSNLSRITCNAAIFAMVFLFISGQELIAQSTNKTNTGISKITVKKTSTKADAIQLDTIATDTIPAQMAEYKPTFLGGNDNEFRKWFFSNFKMPSQVPVSKRRGIMVVHFTLDRKGRVESVKILKGLHPVADAETKRVIMRSPAWTPGLFKGSPVPVRINMRLDFK